MLAFQPLLKSLSWLQDESHRRDHVAVRKGDPRMTANAAAVFDAFALPGTDLAAHAYEYASTTNDRIIFDHCIRSYVYGRQIAELDGLRRNDDFDDEVLFLSCVLHDLGLGVAGGNAEVRFEVAGADLAVDFLREYGLGHAKSAAVWDAIALHTADGIAIRKQPEIAYAQRGIFTDVLGVELPRLDTSFVEQIGSLLPRTNLSYVITDQIARQVHQNPSKGSPATFPGMIARLHPEGAQLPSWYDALAASPWADQPTA
jgi:hypothetical protein